MAGARETLFGPAGERAASRFVWPWPKGLIRLSGWDPPRRRVMAAAIALAATAALTPIGLTGLLDAPIGSDLRLSGTLVLLILAPALVALVVALRGLEHVLAGFTARPDGEGGTILARIFGAAAALAFLLAAAIAAPAGDAIATPLAVAALALLAGWLVLLHAILRPAGAYFRQPLASATDIALLSAFLHTGGALTAVWYPAYFYVISGNGRRFGLPGLAASAALCLAGFAAVVATTAFWRAHPLLSAALLLALTALPAGAAGLVRQLARTQARIAALRAAHGRFLALVADDLQAPAAAILDCADSADRAAPTEALTSLRSSARAMLSRLDEIRDLAAIETARLAPEARCFDLHELAHDVVGGSRPLAAEKNLAVTLQIDPRLPYRLRGWVSQLRRVLAGLIGQAIERADKGPVRISLAASGQDGEIVWLRATIRDDGEEPTAERRSNGIGIAVIERLVAIMGGRLHRSSGAGRGDAVVLELPLAIDLAAPDPSLDFARAPILIVTEDPLFAQNLAEPLGAWHGEPRWIGAGGTALGALARAAADRPALVILDGRGDVLEALGWAHRAAAASRQAPPAILFLAEPPWVESLIERADAVLAGILPAPLSSAMLANALHALPPPSFSQQPSARAEEQPAATDPAAPRVTRIASHPRFSSEAAPIDRSAVESLRSLGHDSDFFDGVIESFRVEAAELFARIGEAAADADAGAFNDAVRSLRRCAANIGGVRLCEMARAMGEVSARELRRQGALHVERLGAELARLDAALGDYLDEGEAAR